MYVKSLFNYKRRKATLVRVGNVTLGGNVPVRIQTMANTNTNDIDASVAQAIRIADVGGEVLRYTTQGLREVESLAAIHHTLRQRHVNIPLVADVHFNPKVAEEAARYVEKVRINPGNYVASKSTDYMEKEWNEELDKINEKLTVLLDICKKNKTAIRIGVNHGSLSPRILNRYGDTPEGLVVSCMEFLRICKAQNFNDIVLSIKSSNVFVMVKAVRLLVATMQDEEMDYPIHLGVTEAGEGEDGRIKSAMGIGALLADGIGNTIRVSLSEEPECEIPVAQKLVDYISLRAQHPLISATPYADFNPFVYHRRVTHAVNKIGGSNPVAVIGMQTSLGNLQPDCLLNELNVCKINYNLLSDSFLEELHQNPDKLLLLRSEHQNPIGEMRAVFHRLMAVGITNPVIIAFDYAENQLEDLQIKAAADFGALLLDGFGDAILLTNRGSAISAEQLTFVAYAILQAARVRMSRTEYISCPGCGRTLFDLQATVAKVKAATAHLKNLKIAIMGCIVNGPGEMADADYGYVGAGKGKVSLYRKNVCLEKNIPEEEAIEKLMEIIQKDL
ncbi:MAG: (E)-4-hydroxy-3-methylbut-2-enyl-diphosphate synthase [Paludibacteraceae bacterium]|jgi:(E)-4-hydroxy-3-methylbut-2-enyl-diphosphate synthase|nr:(E)-4-hydroxy-3-methylbut-2-enyl-diphosphate synthase [Paludibacteraceae bacterium]MDI9536420.1 (E)-4-hydroxy-3-methylbut-2-enyl-diphosphate synthase [Bacteroidota bacterium]OQC34650.1 MAG: 4-hydroxy-3-methylbut-2-en-1-yl diphosphate synthase [Bacteroidetes bacterium ADurb.Bin057]MBP9039320.1 (E)-4-hydroxy-3-methylbut-2-enyl-diphosphate synthase [Paludibacteraceae bacterium]HOA46541.1 (E)-4-hydroxy-3-methylbut-2-enyl-diphosphate synthase [Paludibacteraceae bacterium]